MSEGLLCTLPAFAMRENTTISSLDKFLQSFWLCNDNVFLYKKHHMIHNCSARFPFT